MRRRAHLIVLALLGAALLTPATAGASGSGSTRAQVSSDVRLAPASAADSARRKHARKKRLRTLRKPARPVITASPLDNAVRVSWRGLANATRYRVKWSFAPWDNWASAARYSSWLPASSRSLTRVMTTDAAHDPTMTALPYANPVFVRAQAANLTRLGALSQWQAVWPRVPQPAAGDPVRFGTYNVMLAGRNGWETRMPVIARNIAARNLGVVALQETLSTDGGDVAAQLSSLTGHQWLVAPTGDTEGRILYDATRFVLTDSGRLNDHSPAGQKILNYRSGQEVLLPWARLSAVGSDRTFVVVSIHFAPSDISGPNALGNRQTGASARAVLAALAGVTNGSEPAVIAGDFAGGYGVWGDPNPAQPTLVRAGWWDSMASLSRSGVTYSTVNKLAVETPLTTVAGRADGIFLRGIHGTSAYQNVANYFVPGTRTPPSDHNLVLTQFQVPR